MNTVIIDNGSHRTVFNSKKIDVNVSMSGGRQKTKQIGTDQSGAKEQIKRESYYHRLKGTGGL